MTRFEKFMLALSRASLVMGVAVLALIAIAGQVDASLLERVVSKKESIAAGLALIAILLIPFFYGDPDKETKD